jgi:hypothetical protein
MLEDRLMPDLAIKVILSGLLDSSWGIFHRSTIVRLTVYDNQVKIGVGEGNMHLWELDAIRETKIKREWVTIDAPRITWVEGIKYIPERKISEMPRGLLPLRNKYVYLFVSDEMQMIFPAYKCFDINFGEQSILSILSPKTLIRDFAEVSHPVFSEEKYYGRVENVEVKAEALAKFFKKGYGIGILRKKNALRNKIEAFPLLGRGDIEIIFQRLNK